MVGKGVFGDPEDLFLYDGSMDAFRREGGTLGDLIIGVGGVNRRLTANDVATEATLTPSNFSPEDGFSSTSRASFLTAHCDSS